MGLFDPFGGGGSSATQNTTTLSDQAQLNKGSAILQGNAQGAAGRGAKQIQSGALDLSGAKVKTTNASTTKLGKNASLTVNNTGLSETGLATLVGSLTQAVSNNAPVPVTTTSTASPGAASGTPAATATDDTATSDGSSFATWLSGLGLTGIVLLGIVLLFLFKKPNS